MRTAEAQEGRRRTASAVHLQDAFLCPGILKGVEEGSLNRKQCPGCGRGRRAGRGGSIDNAEVAALD